MKRGRPVRIVGYTGFGNIPMRVARWVEGGRFAQLRFPNGNIAPGFYAGELLRAA